MAKISTTLEPDVQCDILVHDIVTSAEAEIVAVVDKTTELDVEIIPCPHQ